jgi:hypothetical protein
MDLDITAIAIVGIVFFSSIFITLVIAFFVNRSRESRLQTIRTALERGQPVPPEMLDARATGGRTDLQRGAIFVLLGAGISFFLWTKANPNWAAGMVAVALGLGFVASHFLGRRDEPPAPGV